MCMDIGSILNYLKSGRVSIYWANTSRKINPKGQ